MTSAERGHPAQWLANAQEQHGQDGVVAACAALLGGADPGDVALDLDLLGGPGSAALVAGSAAARYWPRVWAARGLRYAWVDDGPTGRAAERALVAGLHDPHWRVREMCAAVCRLHEVGAAADTLADLLDDDIPRVRVAAAAALGAVGEHEHLPLLIALGDDLDDAVARAAAGATEELRRRLDLPPD